MLSPRTILHLDMDAFFAAVEQLDDPALRGRPVLIGSDRPRGVVATASYEARPFGCHSAQPMAVAKRLCPQAVIVPVRMGRYREVSRRLFGILDQFSPLVQPLSIDEAFLDVTGLERAMGEGPTIARKLKQRVREELGLSASVGVAPNKFLAKLASDYQKPDGLTVITPEMIDSWLPSLPVGRIWGIGPRGAEALQARAIRTIADLRKQPFDWMRRHFGADAERIAQLALGQDERAVTSDAQAKSISQEQTFETDLIHPEQVRTIIGRQAEEVAFRLRRHGLFARTIGLKIRYGEFKTVTRSQTLSGPTHRTDAIRQTARGLFEAWSAAGFQPVRLIGVAAKELGTTGGEAGLFTQTADEKQSRLDEALDRITTRYGRAVIHRGE
jgi:DNA polymerase-4